VLRRISSLVAVAACITFLSFYSFTTTSIWGISLCQARQLGAAIYVLHVSIETLSLCSAIPMPLGVKVTLLQKVYGLASFFTHRRQESLVRLVPPRHLHLRSGRGRRCQEHRARRAVTANGAVASTACSVILRLERNCGLRGARTGASEAGWSEV